MNPHIARLMLAGVLAVAERNNPPRVHFSQKEGDEWRPWPDSSTPKPPGPEDAPFFPAGPGMAQWPNTGVHFHAIRFGGRVWDAVNGWRDGCGNAESSSREPRRG